MRLDSLAILLACYLLLYAIVGGCSEQPTAPRVIPGQVQPLTPPGLDEPLPKPDPTVADNGDLVA